MEKKESSPPTPQHQQQLMNNANPTANTPMNNSFNQGNNTSLLQDGLSPTPSLSSMAVLSPPASRYAFDNALNSNIMTANIPPLPTLISSPLLSDTNAMNSIEESLSANLNNANKNTNSNFYNCENDIPAFEPKTKLILENFTYDLKTFTNWIKNLTIDEQKTTMEIFLNNIHPDAIPFVKSQVDNIDTLIKEGNYKDELNAINNRGCSNDHENNLLFSSINDNTQTFAPVRPVSPILALNSEPLTLDGLLNSEFQNLNISGGNSNPNSNRMFRNVSNEIIRPKSAGPSYSDFGMTNSLTRPQSPLLRVFSPDGTSHQHNNLPSQYQYQQNSHMQQQQQYPSNPYSMAHGNQNSNANSNSQLNSDFASQNAIKLNNLNHSFNTITSRNHLDSTKGNVINPIPLNMNNGNSHYNHHSSYNNISNNKPEERGRIKNSNFLNLNKYKSSNSLPPAPRNNNANLSPLPSSSQLNQNGPNSSLWKAINRGQGTNSTGLGSNGGSNNIDSISLANNSNTNGNNTDNTFVIHSPIPTKGGSGSGTGSNNTNNSAIAQIKSPMPKDIASKKLLENIPMWLKALRLHKYTENLQDLNWKDLIELDDAQLSDLGVSTVGARNKLLKSFVFVKENLHD